MEAAGTPGFVVAAAAAGGDGGSCGRQRPERAPASGMEGHCPAAAEDHECSQQHSAKFPPCSSSFSLLPEGRAVLGEQTLGRPE